MFGGLGIVLAAVVILPAAILLIWALVRRKR
jgi:Na+-transporting methylmalonyl-CoA/oxaloacetate decarboxylase gamma subunit